MRGVDASVTRNVSVRIRVARYVMGGQAILCEWPREFYGRVWECIYAHTICVRPRYRAKKFPSPEGREE